MLELSRGLSPRALDALAELEQRTVTADGGRIKLEWGVLRTRPAGAVSDVLYWEADRLVGFAGLYAFGSGALEITGMVDPDRRRAGIGTTLLDAALGLGRERGYAKALLVTPRDSAGGRALATGRGARLAHSEFALILREPLPDRAADPRVHIRPATAGDGPSLRALLIDGFGRGQEDFGDPDVDSSDHTLLVEFDGEVVGTVRRTLEDGVGGVYGFVIATSRRGRGLGREVLRRVCRQLQTEGAGTVRLEVLVDNESALGLYTSVGFAPVTTEDYFEIPIA